MILIIIYIAIFTFGSAADILTTKANNDGDGGMFEANKRYRLPNGDADIKKLTSVKMIWFFAILIPGRFWNGIFSRMAMFSSIQTGDTLSKIRKDFENRADIHVRLT